jgi:hypothetical protein
MVSFNKIIGLTLFTFTYIISGVQIFAVYKINTNDDSYLNFYKIIFYLLAFGALLSHLMVSISDPGKITHENNLQYLDFYTTTRGVALMRADKFNLDQKDKRVIEAPADFYEDDETDSDIENDDNEYSESKITIDVVKDIEAKFKVNLEKCRKCNVVKVPEANHCFICQGYVLYLSKVCIFKRSSLPMG